VKEGWLIDHQPACESLVEAETPKEALVEMDESAMAKEA
jgi:hypothetical protein